MGSVRGLPDLSVTALIRARHLPPERPAAGQSTVRVTRGELLGTSAAWARVLAAEGCGREVPVAVLLPRGLDALTAILACEDGPLRGRRWWLRDVRAPAPYRAALALRGDAPFAVRVHGFLDFARPGTAVRRAP